MLEKASFCATVRSSSVFVHSCRVVAVPRASVVSSCSVSSCLNVPVGNIGPMWIKPTLKQSVAFAVVPRIVVAVLRVNLFGSRLFLRISSAFISKIVIASHSPESRFAISIFKVYVVSPIFLYTSISFV